MDSIEGGRGITGGKSEMTFFAEVDGLVERIEGREVIVYCERFEGTGGNGSAT